MKISLWLSCLVTLIPACGFAQVSVNAAALRQLEGLAPAAPAAQAQPATARPPWHKALVHHTRRPAKPETMVPKAPAKPDLASKPAPSVPAVAKPAPPPPAAKPAPKPAALPVARIEFAPGSAALPAGAAATLKPFCAAASPVPVVTHAPADPADPSGAMRLSLNRAFAIRDALAACGLEPQNIIPRALGDAPGADNNQAMIGAGGAP